MDYTIPVIIPFDMILDTDFGVLKYIQMKSPNSKFFYKSFLGMKDDVFLRRLIVMRKNVNPLVEFMKDEYINKADDIYNKLITKLYPTVLKCSCETTIFNMILRILGTSSDTIKVTIACKSKLEQQEINLRLSANKKSCRSVIMNYPQDIKLADYENFFIKNIYDMNDLPADIYQKNIFIGKYGYNMEDDHPDVPLTDIVTPYAMINKINTIDIYSNVDLHTVG